MTDHRDTAPPPTTATPSLVQSTPPISLDVPGRAVPLQLRVTAPLTGEELPVVVLSHGHGPSRHLSSLYGYGPLANLWAARGFCVLQPTNLDSGMLGLRGNGDPEAPLFWRSRATDVSELLDHLPAVEGAAP